MSEKVEDAKTQADPGLKEKVEQILEKIRPMLMMDGGRETASQVRKSVVLVPCSTVR